MIDSTTFLEVRLLTKSSTYFLNYAITFLITYVMNYETLHFEILTEYSLQYHTTPQKQTKSKQQWQYNYGLRVGQRQNSRKSRT